MLCGRAGEAYLGRYEAERRPVALRLVSTTDRVFGAVTAVGRLPRFVRSRVVPAAGPLAVRVVPNLPLAGRLFSYLSQTRIHYWMSSDAKAAAHGRRGPVVAGG